MNPPFKVGTRVRVTQHYSAKAIQGKTGTVVKLPEGYEAWIGVHLDTYKYQTYPYHLMFNNEVTKL